jgi:WhiB family redox-sensing transcriptional regulator
MADHQWLDDAACRLGEPEDWFPHSEQNMTRNNIEALDTCRKCLVRLTCLQTALNERLEHGIYGGTLPSQRRRMNKRPKVKKVGEAWTVQHLESTAHAHTWQMALTFATTIAEQDTQ